MGETAELREGGRLVYRAGNICNHFFTRDFLKRVCEEHEKQLPHHVAKKKIPFTDLATGNAVKPTENNGVKLEKFVFWECHRDDEFSPLKNGAGAAKDTAETSRNALFQQHRRFLEAAGATIAGPPEAAVEISPLASYAGEGLDKYKGTTLTAPCSINKGDLQNGTS